MALILERVCSRSALQGLLASSATGGSSLLALLAAGCTRGAASSSSQGMHSSHDLGEECAEQHTHRALSGSTAGSRRSSGSAALREHSFAAGAAPAPAGTSAYATASTAAATAALGDEAAPPAPGASLDQLQPQRQNRRHKLPEPAPSPKGAHIASRKPALKKPSRHQWFYCDVRYDPMKAPPKFPLPPYAPAWARQKDYRRIYYQQRPDHHRNKYHRGWLKNMQLADQRWKEAWQAKLAKRARWRATVKRKQADLKRAVAWRAWQAWKRAGGQGAAGAGEAGAPAAAAVQQ